ncbi:MAG: glycosyltransferase family 39 protein [Acidobacteria bacterium]|nr:glycosyltransferase family 39 protein [Acidobacteriota bacterium]
MDRRTRRTLLALWFFLGLLPLFLRPLWEPDEARYAEIPREMLAAGDWLTPRLNGLLYFEKPPLQYWLSAISMKLFGVHAWAARLPLALASGLMLWAAWRLARRLGARDPRWASFMAATALLGFVVGQILTLDALFSAFLVAGLAAFVEAVAARREGSPATGWTLAAYACFAGALLTKGLAELILTGGMFVLSLPFAWRDAPLRRALLRTALDPAGWALYLALSVPWFILVERANPGHAQFFFIHEHFTRFLTHQHARQGSSNWLLDKLYFAAVLGVGLLPWLSAAVVGIKRGWAFVRRDARALTGATGNLNRWVVAAVLAAFAWPLLFFSLSGSKLPPYILPAVVPLAALAASFERTGEEEGAFRRVGWELLVLGVLLLAGAVVSRREPGLDLFWALAPGAALGALGIWVLRPVGLSGARWMVLLGTALWILAFGVHRSAGPSKDVSRLVRMAPPGAQWISFGQYFQAVPFLTGERCVVVAGTGELAFGRARLSPSEAERWLPESPEALLPTARRMAGEQPRRPVMVLAKDRDWEAAGPETRRPFVEVARWGNNLLLGLP